MAQYNNAQMRNWFIEFFTDEEDLDFFIEDNFEGIFAQFEEGMSQKKKARLLTKHCEENKSYEQLLNLLKLEDPDRFESFPPPDPLDDKIDEAKVSDSVEEEPQEKIVTEKTPSTEVTETLGSKVEEPSETPSGQDVFISYSRRDETFVKQLYQQLMLRNISAWYDRVEIKPGSLWREAIVDGVTNCKVFLLVLSPDSTKSDPVRREISLAQMEEKKILPLMWRQTEFPKNIKYQLAGIQYLDLKETTSQENFEKIATAVRNELGGLTAEEKLSDEPTIAPEISATKTRAKPKLGLSKKQTVGTQATRRAIFYSLITPLQLEETARESISEELGWLFTAADHLLQIRRGDEDPNSPVPVEVPGVGGKARIVEAIANDDFSLKLIEGQITSLIKQTNIYLRNLRIELRKQAQLGGEEAASVGLLNSINSQRLAVAQRTQELAELMYQVYGVRMSIPDRLVEEFQSNL